MIRCRRIRYFASVPRADTSGRATRSRLVAAALVTADLALANIVGFAWAQEQAPPTRTEIVASTSLPAMGDYSGLAKALNPLVPTAPVSARIPGVPVRQHPVNTGLYPTGGCQQCHRLAGPIPPDNAAPPDVFDQLPTPTIHTPAPQRFTRLTTAPTRDEYPTWSPDGTMVAFASNREGTFDIWIADVHDLLDGTSAETRP